MEKTDLSDIIIKTYIKAIDYKSDLIRKYKDIHSDLIDLKEKAKNKKLTYFVVEKRPSIYAVVLKENDNLKTSITFDYLKSVSSKEAKDIFEYRKFMIDESLLTILSYTEYLDLNIIFYENKIKMLEEIEFGTTNN